MAGEFQLMLLPGLGADVRLFEPQRRAFPQLVVPPWIPPKKNESLSAYAARMAEMIEPPPSGPWILGGVSMGGMIAYEMARHRKPDTVVLIASCRTRQSLRHGFHAGAHVVPWLPVGIWSVAKWLAPSVLAGSRRYDAAAQSRLVRMFQEMDSAFMHWALSAILGWNPTLLAGVRVFQIHGGRDLMIPARSVDADTLIADGGHMINLTHAEEVNAFIAKAAACAS
jgi:pimeloyl-ACP methyl ester carboxylesterase